jgi:hypothetical protein
MTFVQMLVIVFSWAAIAFIVCAVLAVPTLAVFYAVRFIWSKLAKPKGPRRLKVSAAAFALLVILSAADASACSRCRHYGSACYYYKPAVVAQVVAPVVQQPVYVIQNNTPYPLVGQGSSAFINDGGFKALTAPIYDPNIFASANIQMVNAAAAYNTLAITKAHESHQQSMAVSAPVVERLAAGEASSKVLREAGKLLQFSGLDPAHNTSGGSTGFFIGPGPDGKMQVLPLQSAEIQQLTQRLSTSTTITKSITSTPAPEPGSTESTSLLGRFCASCHGLDVAAPKGGFYIGDDRDVAKTMRENFFSITQHVAVKKTMPPANQPQPTDEQRAAILDEIQGIILKE